MLENDIREKLADQCHKQWSDWMEYLFYVCFPEGKFDEETGNWIIPEWAIKRWMRQMNTSYDELSEEEKNSDRIEADKFIKLLKENNYEWTDSLCGKGQIKWPN